MAEPAPSGLYALNKDRPPERGARIARREERADWASVSDEERGEAGCPARPLVLIQRIQATRLAFVLAVSFAASLTASSFGRAEDFYLKDGDRVVFYGDSITAQREYTARVEEFVLTRFPG